MNYLGSGRTYSQHWQEDDENEEVVALIGESYILPTIRRRIAETWKSKCAPRKVQPPGGHLVALELHPGAVPKKTLGKQLKRKTTKN